MEASIGIVIPAYKPDIDRLTAYIFALEDTLHSAQIRIELDDPDTATLDRLKTVPAVVNTVPYRRGKGAAITAGFEALETDVHAFVDADGSTQPAELEKIIRAVTQGQATLAVGSRRHPDSNVLTHRTRFRRYLGDVFSWVSRRALDIELHDYQCGAKAITKDGWNAVRDHLYESGFAWDIELIAIADALELSIAEIPIDWHDKPGSTVSPFQTTVELTKALYTVRKRARLIHKEQHGSAVRSNQWGPQKLIDRDE